MNQRSCVPQKRGIILLTARSVRKNIIKARPWKFDGSFENYLAPEMLQTFKWIIAGPRNELENEKRKRYIDQTANNITQLIHQATKSDSKLRCKPTSDSNKTFYNTKETPFSVGLGLLIRKKIRSKDIVNILANLNLPIDYEKVLRIETDIANAVVQRAFKNNGVICHYSVNNLSLFTIGTFSHWL